MRLLFLLLFLSFTGSKVLAQGSIIITEHGKFQLLKVESTVKVPTEQLFSYESEEVAKKLLDTLATVAADKQSAVFEDVFIKGWCQMRRHSYPKQEYVIWWTFGSW